MGTARILAVSGPSAGALRLAALDIDVDAGDVHLHRLQLGDVA